MQHETDPAEDTPLLAYATCPDKAVAQRIAHALVDAHIAACINIVPGLESVYRWQGRIETDAECLIMIKTRQQRLGDVRDTLTRLHPDDVPEMIAVDIRDGLPDYLAWVINETR